MGTDSPTRAAATPPAAQAALAGTAPTPNPTPEDEKAAAAAIPKRADKGEVIVACALPSGLTASHEGTTVTFAGANAPGAVLGFGVTTDVDRDWYEAWAASMGDFAPLKKGLIFARSSGMADAIKERAPETVTGFEGLNGDKPGPGLEKVAETK